MCDCLLNDVLFGVDYVVMEGVVYCCEDFGKVDCVEFCLV